MKEGKKIYTIPPALTVADIAHVIAAGSDLTNGTIQVFSLPYAISEEEAQALTYEMQSIRMGLTVSVNTDGTSTIVCMQDTEL